MNQSDINSSLKKPFIENTQQYNFNSWFDNNSKSPQNTVQKNNDWNIDYSLEAKKDENPFKPKQQLKTLNSTQINQSQKNLEFFNEEPKVSSHVYNNKEYEEEKTQYIFENEVSDAKILFKVNKNALDKLRDEYVISEKKNSPVKNKENFNVTSKETLNLVESDNNSKNKENNNNIELKESGFKAYQETNIINHEKNEQIMQRNPEDFLKKLNNNAKENENDKINILRKNDISYNINDNNINNDEFEKINLDQVSVSPKLIKTEDSCFESKFKINCLPIFNFNNGWTFLQIKNKENIIFSPIIKENNITESVKEFPGPIKIEKNSNNITHTYNKLFTYINQTLNNLITNTKESTNNISKRFAWTILNEILLNKKLSIYELLSSTKFRDSMIIFIETHFFNAYEKTINLEEFKNETEYLLNLINLNEQQYEDLIEDNQWETIFFAKLFLSSEKTQEMGKDVKDILIHYVEKTYKKWYPMYMFTIMKLAKFDKFYDDSQLLSQNSMLYFWLILKLVGQYDEKMWQGLLQTLFYHLNDQKKDSYLQFSFLVMFLGFDNENLPLLLRQNTKVHMIQMLESFFFLANTLSNFQYDTSKFLYKNLFPGFIIHAYNLLENDFHLRAIEYVNLVESSKNMFFALEKNKCFMASLREIKQRLIANIEFFYVPKDQRKRNYFFLLEDDQNIMKKTDSSNDMSQNTINEKDFSTNLKQNFFNYFNSAIGMIKTPLNEIAKGKLKYEGEKSEKIIDDNKNFYYDKNLKTWVLNGVPSQNEEQEVERKKELEKDKISLEKQYVSPPLITKSIYYNIYF